MGKYLYTTKAGATKAGKPVKKKLTDVEAAELLRQGEIVKDLAAAVEENDNAK